MVEIVFFMLGLFLGFSLSYVCFRPLLAVQKLHETVKTIEQKYSQLLNVIQQWQKKV